jgi:Molybdopterin-binding domain of aldehyde dehydrogenase
MAKVWARKFTVAHDCGLIINPDGLRRCIEGNVVQGASRALSEEVTFDRAKVTSIDWTSYPILDITEAPEEVDIVLINHPELAAGGCGRELDPPSRCGDRERRLRCDRRASAPRPHNPGAAHAALSVIGCHAEQFFATPIPCAAAR